MENGVPVHVGGLGVLLVFAATYAASRGWDTAPWQSFAWFNGIVGVVTMIAAVFLTLYSLWLYVIRYGRVVTS